MRKKCISLCLPAGGVRAASYWGAVKALEDNNFGFEAIVCYSGGAIVAVSHAMNIPSEVINNHVSKKALISVFSANRLKKRLQSVFGTAKLEDLPIKIYVVMTDFETLEPVVFESGSVVELLAATSIQSPYSPITLNGKKYFDGGLTAGLESRVLRERGHNNILGLYVGKPKVIKAKFPFSLFQPLQKSISAATYNLVLMDEQLNEPDLFINNLASDFSTMDIDKAQEMYNSGYQKIVVNINLINKKLS